MKRSSQSELQSEPNNHQATTPCHTEGFPQHNNWLLIQSVEHTCIIQCPHAPRLDELPVVKKWKSLCMTGMVNSSQTSNFLALSPSVLFVCACIYKINIVCFSLSMQGASCWTHMYPRLILLFHLYTEIDHWRIESTVEPRYNEVLGTMKITLLYQVSHYIRVKKQRNIKSWDQQNYLVIKGFVISDLFIMRFHCSICEMLL